VVDWFLILRDEEEAERLPSIRGARVLCSAVKLFICLGRVKTDLLNDT